jgi:hypothetical protein
VQSSNEKVELTSQIIAPPAAVVQDFLDACGGECWKNAFLSAKKSEISDKFIHKNQKSVKKFAG